NFFFFQAEDGIRDGHVTGVQTCALPILYLNYGTTNINAALAADLKSRTVFPPIVYPTNQVIGNTNLVLFPQAQRDTDIPDIGYHYEPLDYVFGTAFFTNSTILITNGAAIGLFCAAQASYGLAPDNGTTLIS